MREEEQRGGREGGEGDARNERERRESIPFESGR